MQRTEIKDITGRARSRIETVAMSMKLNGGRNRAALLNGAARNDGYKGVCTAHRRPRVT